MQPALSFSRAVEFAQARLLPSISPEIAGGQPALEVELPHRPFAVEHGKVGRITVAALCDFVLPQNALEYEAIPEGGAPRRRVMRIAFPLVAPVAQRFEDIACEQILRLCCKCRPLECRRVDNMADLNHAH